MDLVRIIGFFSAACTTAAFLPQVIKSWRTKKTRDISSGWLGLLVVGIFSWIVYGILREDLVIIIGNVATVAMLAVLLYLKIKYH